MTEREFAIDVVRRLRESGYQAYWAGGCVRDELLGKAPADYDVATNARPEEVTRTFRRTIAVGAAFGVIEVIGPRLPEGGHHKVQVATFRNDGIYSDGRRPDTVSYSSAEEDAQRRDFTINGMFLDPLKNEVIDYVCGQEDLRNGVLRAIGDAEARFAEDKLRLLRAVRMSARFGFPIEPTTRSAIRKHAGDLVVVSAERIAEELRKLLTHPGRADAVRQIVELGLGRTTFSECAGELEEPSTLDRATHVLDRLRGPEIPESTGVTVPLGFAAVMCGTRPSPCALDWDEHSARRIEKMARRLKMSTAEQVRMEWLVRRSRALSAAETLRRSQLYPILLHPGIRELLSLVRAERSADGASSADADFAEGVLRTAPRDQMDPPPILTGNHLTSWGWRPGPVFKQVLDRVRDAQWDEEVGTLEDARALAERIRDEASGGT